MLVRLAATDFVPVHPKGLTAKNAATKPDSTGRTITMIVAIGPAGRRIRIGHTIAKFFGKRLRD